MKYTYFHKVNNFIDKTLLIENNNNRKHSVVNIRY